MMTPAQRTQYSETASFVFIAAFLLMVLLKGLLAALFSGLLVYSLIHLMSPFLAKKISGPRARLVAVATIGTVVIAALTATVWAAIVFFQSDAGNVQALLKKMADIVDASRHQFPVWLQSYLPANANDLSGVAAQWLREHANEAKILGAEAGRTAAHLLIGMIIGALAALHQVAPGHDSGPLAAALQRRLMLLNQAFRSVVFAQVRISVINTVITAVFLVVALPLAGVHLPLTKTMIAITFLAGLLPVIGNLVSNTILVVVSMSHSLDIALASLVFLILIHKFEYFLNARIIGSSINAHIWEMLTAMLVMESLFGLPGVIAAPVLYAYAKNELCKAKLL